jgi:hypothetical protein
MKKLILLAVAVLTMSACGNKTKDGATDADSTQVFEVPDTLNTVEAIIQQVDSVYAYWNYQRQNYKEGMPTLDELFGTKEWQQVRNDALEADRDCECGGFFDFGDEGPLDPWVYDCYEGTVSANNIEAKILPNGMAEVKFLVKDAVTTKGIPMRWMMRVEDGQWRVANIIFEKDGGVDLLSSLRDYGWEFKTDKNFDITKIYDELVSMAEPLFAGYDPIEFHEYAHIDVDHDGQAELWLRNNEARYSIIVSLADNDPHILIDADERTSISFFPGVIQSSGGCGTGCHMAEIVVLKNSRLDYTLNNMEQYDMEGNLSENGWEKDGKEIPTEEGEKLYKSFGSSVELYVNWHGIDIERKPKLSDYAE